MINKLKIIAVPVFASLLVSYVTFSHANKNSEVNKNKQNTWDSQPPTNYLPQGFIPKVIKPFNNGYATSWIFFGTTKNQKYNMVVVNENQPCITLLIGSAQNIVNSFYVVNNNLLWIDTNEGEWYVESKSDTFYQPTSVYPTDRSVYVTLQASQMERGWYGNDTKQPWENWNIVFIDKNTNQPCLSYQAFSSQKAKIVGFNSISPNLSFNNIVKNQNIYLTATKNKPSDEPTLFRYAPTAFADNNLMPLNFTKNVISVVSAGDNSKNLYILSDDGVYFYNYDNNTSVLVSWKLQQDFSGIDIDDMDFDGQKLVVIATTDQGSASRIFEIDIQDYSYVELFFDNNEYRFDVDRIKKVFINKENKLTFFYEYDDFHQTDKDFFYIDIATYKSLTPFTPIKPANTSTNHKNYTGYIVGGVLGSVAGISLISFTSYSFFKRKSSNQ